MIYDLGFKLIRELTKLYYLCTNEMRRKLIFFLRFDELIILSSFDFSVWS